MASPTTSVPAVDERLEQMRDALKDNAEARDYFPGLDKLLTKYLENSSYDPNQDTVDKELFIRGMLRCFYKTEKDDTYSKILATYSDEEQRKIRAFVEQKQAADDLGPDFTPGVSPPVREELDSLQHAPAHESHIQTVEDSPILHEAVTNGAESVQRIWQRIKTMLSFWDHDAKEQEITVSCCTSIQSFGILPRLELDMLTPSAIASSGHGVQQLGLYGPEQASLHVCADDSEGCPSYCQGCC